MRFELVDALRSHKDLFGVQISDTVVEHLADYYEGVLSHNPLLHLVGPCSAETFATRHILESLMLLKYLRPAVKFADVGAGAGLPSIPCLIARPDLSALLIESKRKKSAFLRDELSELRLAGRAQVVDRQFEETEPAGCESVTCRALDKFVDKLPKLLKWARLRQLLLFGGPSLGLALAEHKIDLTAVKIPLSDQRYLFVSRT